MVVTLIILGILAAGLGGIAYGIQAIGAELRGIEGDEDNRKGAKDAEADAEKSRKIIEQWRAGK